MSIIAPLIINAMTIDRPDVDNFVAASLWLLSNPTEKLHIFLVGRQFSSALTSAIFNEETKMLEIETWNGDVPVIHSIFPNEIKSFIKQDVWEESMWDKIESHQLLQIFAADLRAYLTACEIQPNQYIIYDGGIPELAGISNHIHVCDYMLNEDISAASYVPNKKADYDKFCKQFRTFDREQRKQFSNIE